MRIGSAALVAAMLSAGPAAAQMAPAGSAEALLLARDVAAVIAAEPVCGFTLSEPALRAFLEARVAPDDLGFPSDLRDAVGREIRSREDMSPSLRALHCGQIRRAAGTLGLLAR